MLAKKHPSPDAAHADQTRKVDGMSELVAGMLVDDADATLPPPEASPGSLSAVRPTERRPSTRPPAAQSREDAAERLAPKPQVARLVLITLNVALGIVAVVAAVLFTR